jgi:hypothetical protein
VRERNRCRLRACPKLNGSRRLPALDAPLRDAGAARANLGSRLRSSVARAGSPVVAVPPNLHATEVAPDVGGMAPVQAQ